MVAAMKLRERTVGFESYGDVSLARRFEKRFDLYVRLALFADDDAAHGLAGFDGFFNRVQAVNNFFMRRHRSSTRSLPWNRARSRPLARAQTEDDPKRRSLWQGALDRAWRRHD